ncbi:MAG: YicC family protein [Syntrophomonadaceae bacterium]|nr:YicC family protein [Syntrophomonadaceae bacterium]MDD3888326.1 YicC family protein [Syntrophomonadaceae bacterium]MDD4548833.1 YicC family protein [Syntrophomonadaceae bacterium]
MKAATVKRKVDVEMVKSMTGFGRGQLVDGGYEVLCEVKGVNHRYLDINLRLSRRYNALEDKIKEEIKKYVNRGRLDISINIEKIDESLRNIKVDKDLAIAYHDYLKELAENLNISPEIKIIDIFRLPEVFTLEDQNEDLDITWEALKKALTLSMKSLVEMRSKEGNNLAIDIVNRNHLILSMVERMETKSPEVAEEYFEKLHRRISELVSQEVVDEQRILQEAAIFADKSNITEEIVRLRSHVKHLDELMEDGDSIGRKCDFLVQEMFREINTIASKANNLEISRIVVDAKAELEKIREQLQNIE